MFTLKASDPLYRDFEYLRESALDRAIDIALQNQSTAHELEYHFDKVWHSDDAEVSLDAKLKHYALAKQARKADLYWRWYHQGLKDIKYRNRYYPEMLLKVLDGEIPAEHEEMYHGYFNGFYYHYQLHDGDAELRLAIDPDAKNRKPFMPIPQIDDFTLAIDRAPKYLESLKKEAES
jgi:hypothetical protein